MRRVAPFAPLALVALVTLSNPSHRAISEPVAAQTAVPRVFPPAIDGGAWPAGHVQGIAVDREREHVYMSFTTLLVKIDFRGNVLGTVEGLTGHLGDLAFDPRDGRVYGSLEYKSARAFYIAMIDGRRVDRRGIKVGDPAVVRTVHLAEVVNDYAADMDGNGTFDGDKADTPDHRYGCSGIDGVAFGPRFGRREGPFLLTVAYGIYSNTSRTDNDHQVLLQYDTSGWNERYARPLVESAPHRSGPSSPDAKYFVRTGNTTYGVQNLEYDAHSGRWLLGVYRGRKPSFPNYTLFAIDASATPGQREIEGTSERGALLPLAADGLHDEATGVRGWHQKADVGLESLGGGLFYLVRDGRRGSLQTAELTLVRWIGGAGAAFERVTDR